MTQRPGASYIATKPYIEEKLLNVLKLIKNPKVQNRLSGFILELNTETFIVEQNKLG